MRDLQKLVFIIRAGAVGIKVPEMQPTWFHGLSPTLALILAWQVLAKWTLGAAQEPPLVEVAEPHPPGDSETCVEQGAGARPAASTGLSVCLWL